MSLLGNAGSDVQNLLHVVENKIFPNFPGEKLTQETLDIVYIITAKRDLKR